jgi:hypothetical protein
MNINLDLSGYRASEFLPELAGLYTFLAEIRYCPGVTQAIRLK